MNLSSNRIDELRAKTIAKAFSKLLPVAAGKIAGAAPGSVVRSLVEQAYRPELSRHIGGHEAILPARIARYPFPEDFPAWFRREKALDPIYTYHLKDVVVSPRSGLVWLEDEALVLQESVGSLRRLLGWGNLLWQTGIEPAVGPDDAVVLPSKNYYHWLLESVPSFLRSLRRSPSSVQVLVPEDRLGVVDCFLDRLPLTAGQKFVTDRPVRVKNLTLTGIPDLSGFMDESEVEDIRRWDVADKLAGQAEKRIYLSRKHNPRRRLANEDDLERELIKVGFQVVYAESLSLLEQAQLFSQAQAVVSPHGAGLSNLVWRRDTCRVVEIFPSEAHNDCFARLATLLGFEYDYIKCEAHANSAGSIDVGAVLATVH